LNYIQEQAGTLFDPTIVSAFMKMIREKELVFSVR